MTRFAKGNKVIITIAPTGGMPGKHQSPRWLSEPL
jgi:hypothetical protein